MVRQLFVRQTKLLTAIRVLINLGSEELVDKEKTIKMRKIRR